MSDDDSEQYVIEILRTLEKIAIKQRWKTLAHEEALKVLELARKRVLLIWSEEQDAAQGGNG